MRSTIPGGGRAAACLVYDTGRGQAVLRLQPVILISSVVAIGAILAWAVVLTGYIFFKDDVLHDLVRRHARTVGAYEDRLAELRLKLDATLSRQFVNQHTVEQAIATLAERQEGLESRQGRLHALLGRATQAGFEVAPRMPIERPRRPAWTASLPGVTFFTGTVAGPSEPDTADPLDGLAETPVIRRAKDLDARLSQLLQQQSEALKVIETGAESRIAEMRNVFGRIRIAPPAAGKGGLGGPMIPIDAVEEGDGFDKQAAHVEDLLNRVERLRDRLDGLPIRSPVPQAPVTSGFGPRMDPFLGRRALHSGIDFAADGGTPVLATGRGVVLRAGWAGGYGKLVEIEHDDALVSRFGHLSRIAVQSGQSVEPGDVIGYVGSTGRSTGPHLHYETRLAGGAVDPMRFLVEE